jgi:hypothetical protein
MKDIVAMEAFNHQHLLNQAFIFYILLRHIFTQDRIEEYAPNIYEKFDSVFSVFLQKKPKDGIMLSK